MFVLRVPWLLKAAVLVLEPVVRCRAKLQNGGGRSGTPGGHDSRFQREWVLTLLSLHISGAILSALWRVCMSLSSRRQEEAKVGLAEGVIPNFIGEWVLTKVEF